MVLQPWALCRGCAWSNCNKSPRIAEAPSRRTFPSAIRSRRADCSNDTDPAWLNAQIAFTAALHHWINNEGATVVCNNETPGVVSYVYAYRVRRYHPRGRCIYRRWLAGRMHGRRHPLFNTIGHAWISKFQYLQLILPNFPMAVGDYACAGYNAATVPANQVAWVRLDSCSTAALLLGIRLRSRA